MEPKKIYHRYLGNSKGEIVQIFQLDNSFRCNYQTFKRTNPSQSERKLGFKAKRIIQSEQTFEFSHLKDIDFSKYPFAHLMDKFQIDSIEP